MKTILRILTLLIVLTALLAAPASAYAQTPGGDEDGKVVFGGSYRLDSGQTLEGSLAVFGGEATLEEGSLVNGDIAISGGNMTVRGEVNGDIVILGGNIALMETAIVHGDITTIGGSISRADGARVDGAVQSGPNSLSLPIPGRVDINPELPFRINFDPIGRFIWAVFQAVVLAGLAALVALLAPTSTRRVAATIATQPVVSGALGALSAILAPALLVIMAITILLIPVSLLGFILLAIAVAYGWIALGLEIGERIAAASRQNWTAPLAAGIGTLILALLANVIALVDCVGWIAPFLVSIVGLGGVIASRFGSQVYAPAAPVTSSAVIVPAVSRPAVAPSEWQPPAGAPPAEPPAAPSSGGENSINPPTGGF